LPGDLVAPTGVVPHGVDNRSHVLPPNAGQGLAGVQTLQFDQLFLMLFQERGRPLQDAPALGCPQSAPDLQCGACGGYGKVHILLPALSHGRNW
jgi:hypothetical protein